MLTNRQSIFLELKFKYGSIVFLGQKHTDKDTLIVILSSIYYWSYRPKLRENLKCPYV